MKAVATLNKVLKSPSGREHISASLGNNHVLRGLEHRINLTLDDRERLAYITGDTKALTMYQHFEEELEPEPEEEPAEQPEGYDAAAELDEIIAHQVRWKANAWCLTRVAGVLRSAAPLKKSRLRMLAAGLEELAAWQPRKRDDETSFKAHFYRICGLNG